MSTRPDQPLPRPWCFAAIAAAAALLLAAPVAHAATTSISVSVTTGTINLDAANDAVTITNVGGNLSHGLMTSGSCPILSCNSDIDWDTTTLGNQTLRHCRLPRSR